MDHPDSTQNKPIWIVVAVVGVFVVVFGIALILFAQLGTSNQVKNQESTATSSTNTKSVTSDDVKKNLDDLSDSLDQADSDQKASKAALDDSKNRVKLGN